MQSLSLASGYKHIKFVTVKKRLSLKSLCSLYEACNPSTSNRSIEYT